MLTSLTSQQFHGGSSTSFKSKPTQPAGLSNALRMMQLDDYEIKPSEIEIMTKLDGSPSTLGRGAFGEVRMGAEAAAASLAVKLLLSHLKSVSEALLVPCLDAALSTNCYMTICSPPSPSLAKVWYLKAAQDAQHAILTFEGRVGQMACNVGKQSSGAIPGDAWY